METAALVELANTMGVSAIFLVGLVYVYKSQEKKEARLAAEVKEREKRLGARLDSTEEYIRTTLNEAIQHNTSALNEMASALKNLPCASSNGQCSCGYIRKDGK